jgi:phosphoribosylamine---glycine ligase
VTALADSVTQARERAYRAVDRIRWPEGFCRRDIGWREIAREGAGSPTDGAKSSPRLPETQPPIM